MSDETREEGTEQEQNPDVVSESLDGAIMTEVGLNGEELTYGHEEVTEFFDGEPVEPLGVDDDEGEPDDTDGSDEGTDETDPDAPPAETVDEGTSEEEALPTGDEGATPPVEVERDPFSIRVDRQDFDVPDAYVDGDNIVIPRESFQRVIQPRLADRNAWIQERQQFQRQIEQLDPETNPTVVQARTTLEKLNEIFEDEDKAYAFFKDFNAQKDRLITQAERAALQAEREQFQRQAQTQTAETQGAELVEQMDTALDTLLGHAKEIDDYQGVDFEYVRDLLEPMKGSFFFEAPEDMPQFGLSKGEIGVRVDLVEQVIQKEARRASTQREGQKAAKRNSRVTGTSDKGGSTPPPPPTPTTPVEETETRETPQTKEEWETRLAAIAAGR